VPPAGFEPASPTSERPQSYAFDTDEDFQPNFRNSSALEFQMVVLLAILRVLENRVLRRIFGPKRDEVTGEWRKLHNEELNDRYCSPNIVRVIKWRRMRWAGHIARMG